MNRRDFLGSLAAGVPALLLEPRLSSQRRLRHVIVVGAGLAGLAAALALRDDAWNVTILEARARPGGRVYTLREPFSDGLYAEAGAARIQDTHEFTLRYVKRFNLELDPFFPSDGNNVTCVAGRRIVMHPGVTEHFEVSASNSWIDDPWARGASADFHPGQLSRYYQTLRAPEGRIYFAGEYTSPWSGWMNGGLESGERVAAQIAMRSH
jgi:monoamine oxidase